MKRDVTAGELPEMETIDAAERSARLRDRYDTTERGLHGGVLPTYLSDYLVSAGAATSVSAPETVDIDRGDDEVAELRRLAREALRVAGHTGAGYQKTEIEDANMLAGGAFFPLPAVGYGYVEGKGVRTTRLSSVRLVEDASAPAAPLTLPETADAFATLKPGESVAVTREGETKLYVGNLKCVVDRDLPDASWLTASPIGVDLQVGHQGETTTEVVRGEGDAATLTVSAKRERDNGAEAGFLVGIYLGPLLHVGKEIMRRLLGASKTASELVNTDIWAQFLATGYGGVHSARGRTRVAEVELDLSKKGGRRAYEAGVRGDLDAVRTVASMPGSGVNVSFSAASEIRKRVVPITLGLFGMGVAWESEQEERDTRVVQEGRSFERHSRGQTRSREVNSIDLRNVSREVGATVAHTSAVDGEAMPEDVPASHVRFYWRKSVRDHLTSREELLEELDWTAGLLGHSVPDGLQPFRETVAGLEPQRLGRIGPRNEAGNTQLFAEVSLSARALDEIAEMSDEQVFAALAEASRAPPGNEQLLRGERGPLPDWTEAEVRGRYQREANDGVLEWKELNPSYLWARHAAFEATRVASMIKQISLQPRAERYTSLTKLLRANPEGRRLLSAIALLVGPEHLSVDLEIRETRAAGDPARPPLNFELSFRGAETVKDAIDDVIDDV